MQRLEPLRRCYICGLEAITEQDLEKFVKEKRNNYGRANICKTCVYLMSRKGGKYWPARKRSNDKSNPKDFRFKDQFIHLKENPRTNTCSECGRKHPEQLKQQTCFHHTIYDSKHPLENTVELCNSCHIKLHYQKGNIPLVLYAKGHIPWNKRRSKESSKPSWII